MKKNETVKLKRVLDDNKVCSFSQGITSIKQLYSYLIWLVLNWELCFESFCLLVSVKDLETLSLLSLKNDNKNLFKMTTLYICLS